MPTVLFYLFSGIAAGPMGFGIINAASLGKGLLTLVEIGVAIILFEGGLALSPQSFKKESFVIRRILMITIPLTGIGAAWLAHELLKISWHFAIFFGSMIVVTGPTVINSITKNLNLTHRLKIMLKWESIWGDVIGVLMSAFALGLIDQIVSPDPSDSLSDLAVIFSVRLFVGIIIGMTSGFLLARVIMPAAVRLKDTSLPGLIALATAMAVFCLSNHIAEYSGALAVSISGFFLSYLKTESLRSIRHFKEQIATLFIGMLFVLLAAYVNFFPFIWFWPQMIAIALILGLVVRPAAMMTALISTPAKFQERIFASLIGPRGIIAIATASYAILITEGNHEELLMILNLIFVIIFFSGTMATLFCRPLAIGLNVMIPVSETGILITGVNPISSAIAEFASRYVPVSFLDTNQELCQLSQNEGFECICGNWLESAVYEEASADGFSRLLALTHNEALNELIARYASAHLGLHNVFRGLKKRSEHEIPAASSLSPAIAFSEKFFLHEAINRLERNESSIKILEPSEVGNNKITPLIQAVNGKGVRIIEPGKPIADEGQILCFVSEMS
jgi:NhaP-type Na+/H+ or K+/H+ antiporter